MKDIDEDGRTNSVPDRNLIESSKPSEAPSSVLSFKILLKPINFCVDGLGKTLAMDFSSSRIGESGDSDSDGAAEIDVNFTSSTFKAFSFINFS